MAAAISNWYHSSLWTRSRQVQVAPLLARAEENARLGRPPAEAVVINMGDILADDPALLNAIRPKKHETLFGPSLGEISPGPAWTGYGKDATEGGKADELTQETVRAWIAKSKEPSQPTTTLQALVNLKRPSIRLSPLMPDEPSSSQPPMHGLEFEYDLDAPKGRILLQVIPPMHDAAPILIYEAIVDGGFGRHLKVEDGAVFELAKLEDHKSAAVTADQAEQAESQAVPTTSTAGAQATPGAGPTTASKKRFSAFAFRKKTRAAGPAVPVVDAQTANPATASNATPTANAEGHSNGDEEGGVRVRIRIDALDEQDRPLASPNAQTTYLHIVKVGPAPIAGETDAPVEDTRQWVVKVVKREATIGLHTFHLHEIYGLAAGSNSDGPTNNNNNNSASHTYPPNANPEAEAEADAHAYDFAGTECVLCLSEPREVVLLPCRHLVACKDCAMNMIEFGAGGAVVQAEEPAPPPPATVVPAATEGTTNPNPNPPNAADVDLEAGNAAPSATPAIAPVAPAPPIPVAPRRKRKAKGWFCPVCRQPYTSMLRITTTPPEAKKLTSASETDLAEAKPAMDASVPLPTVPPPAATTTTAGSGWARPGFMKSLSIGGKTQEGNAPENTTTESASTSTPAPAPVPSTTTTTTTAPSAPTTDPLGVEQTGR